MFNYEKLYSSSNDLKSLLLHVKENNPKAWVILSDKRRDELALISEEELAKRGYSICELKKQIFLVPQGTEKMEELFELL